MAQITKLMSAFFDDDLSSDQRTALRVWLLESPEHIDQYVVNSFVHTQLIDLLNPHQLRANALVAAESLSSLKSSAPSRYSTGRMLGLALSIAVVLALMFLVFPRRSVVATVTGTTNAKWASGFEKRTVGAHLESGDEIVIDQGTVRLSFGRGGQVALHGPGRLRLDSDMSGHLLHGSLAAFVPEHAVGFTILTPKLRLVDLGTEFKLDLLPNDSCELQVFNGLVEIQFDQPTANGAIHKKLQFSQGQAIQFDAPNGAVKPIEYNNSARLPMSAWSQ
jgi:ferric-dicitrate binding protein FerR (iron transport regulator)